MLKVEALKTELKDEKLLSAQYLVQRDDLKTQLDGKTKELQGMSRNFELE